MSRKIRRVPANWKHPKGMMPYGYDFLPMIDANYEDAARDYDEQKALWDKGEHEEQVDGSAVDCSFEQWHGKAPDPKYYRPYRDEEGVWYQAYQTVSEGTPVTPPFPTLQELEDWLVEKGEMHGTKYEHRFSRQAAHNFCQVQWAPSMTFDSSTGTVKIGIENCE